MSRAQRDIEALQRELTKMRRMLGVAVEQLGGEMKFTVDDFIADRDIGIDLQSRPFVVTSFRTKK